MSKKTMIAIIVTATICGLVFLYLILRNNFMYNAKREFDGNRVRSTDPDKYELSFEFMDEADNTTFNLSAGEELKVSWNVTKGYFSLSVKNEKGEEIYKTDDRRAEDKSEFTLVAAESGEYTVYVVAHKAKGTITVEHK